MRSTIGRRQKSSNTKWIEVMETIEEHISREDVDHETEKAVAEIVATTQGKRAAYAWSGGKDSVVIAELCRRAGITQSMCAVCDLEYPVFFRWIMDNKPIDCEIINTGQNLDWLAQHPDMIFPTDTAHIGRWFSIVQHRAQDDYFKAHRLDLIILGRRRADGNYVGRGSNLYTNGRDITRYSPISSWSHELVLGFIHYNNLPMAPIYSWKDGFVKGTHPWPSRVGMKSAMEGWHDVYEIDPSIVIAAAERISSARHFLDKEVPK